MTCQADQRRCGRQPRPGARHRWSRSPRPARRWSRSPAADRRSTCWPAPARTSPPRSPMRPTRRWRGACLTGTSLRSDSGRRRQPGDTSAAPPDLGDVLRQLAYRRQDRVHLAARGAAPSATTRQQSGGDQQRSCYQRIPGQRRDTPGPRPPSGSSPGTRRRSRAAPDWASPSPR